MALTKTRLTKILRAIKKTDIKFYTVEDLSKDTAIKKSALQDDLIDYLPLVYFGYEYNLKDVLPELEEKLKVLTQTPVKKRIYKKKDIQKYENFVDFVYQNMTDNGGIFDTGYVLTKKDISIIRKLLKEESLKLKNKK